MADQNIKLVRSFECIILGLLIVWLAFCALNVDIELYDGLDTIVNARNFTGQSSYYAENRAPLMGLLMVPADLVHTALELHPLDMRPYHVTMAFLHGLYLILVYLLLIRYFTRSIAVLVSFVVAIPNFIFFSYAPFISHDIFPGLLLLAMLLLADKFTLRPGIGIWLALVVVGAASTLIKHQFAFFWFLLLLAYAIILLPRSNLRDLHSSGVKIWLLLTAAAITSGIITWFALAMTLNAQYPDTHFILGPYKQFEFLVQHSGGNMQFPAWLFLRNFPAYGILTSLLIIPGMMMSLRSSSLHQSIVLVWIFFVLAIQLTGHLEVRYFAVLAPLSAFILVPPLQWLLRKKSGLIVVLILLLISVLPISPYSLSKEAVRVTLPFYQINEARKLLSPLDENGTLRMPVLTNWRMLSFASPLSSPLVGDRFHRLFHLAGHHIVVLMKYPKAQFMFLQYLQLPELSDWPEQSAMVLTNRPLLINPKSWQGGEPIGKYDLLQTTFVADTIVLSQTSTGSLQTDSGDAVVFMEETQNNRTVVLLESIDIVKRFKNSRFLRFEYMETKESFPLKLISTSQLEIFGMQEKPNLKVGQKIIVRGFVLKQVHQYGE